MASEPPSLDHFLFTHISFVQELSGLYSSSIQRLVEDDVVQNLLYELAFEEYVFRYGTHILPYVFSEEEVVP